MEDNSDHQQKNHDPGLVARAFEEAKREDEGHGSMEEDDAQELPIGLGRVAPSENKKYFQGGKADTEGKTKEDFFAGTQCFLAGTKMYDELTKKDKSYAFFDASQEYEGYQSFPGKPIRGSKTNIVRTVVCECQGTDRGHDFDDDGKKSSQETKDECGEEW